MILDLRKRIEVQDRKIQKMFNKDLEDIKKWVEQYDNWKEKYTRRINRINEAEEWVSELEERIMKITVTEQIKEKKKTWGQFDTSGTTLTAPALAL